MIRALALLACLLTVCITASSAFIRHWQGGLACEGWPECYRGVGRATASAGGAATAPAAAATPADRSALGAAMSGLARIPEAEAPASVRIARGLHRVSATVAGVLVLLVVAFGWSTMSTGGRVAAAVALADTVFLSWLGRFTPHDVPLVTVGNLVGGLLLAAALAWIAAGRGGAAARAAPRGTQRTALVALALLALLAWGGTMIGARHAVDACSTPLCLADARFVAAAFDPTQAVVEVDVGAQRGLHVAHRLLGLGLAFVVGLLALRLRAARPGVAVWLVALVAAQVLLGVGTALGTQPLVTATLHNAVAALLVVALAAVAGAATAARGGVRSAG